MSRVSREDWLDAGLALLAAGDARALTLERLCAAMDRTRGSFYHHFQDMPGFVAALLERWQAAHTEAHIDAAESASTPESRAARLRARVSAADLRLERVMRAWAEVEPAAKAAVAAVDARRLDYLTDLARARGKDEETAKILARLEYVAFVGTVALFADLPIEARATLSRSLSEALDLWARPATQAAPDNGDLTAQRVDSADAGDPHSQLERRRPR